MVIRQQTGPWCMPHSLREIQSALRLCETRVNFHQDNDRITVVIAPILLLPYVKNCVLCQGMPDMLPTFGSAPVKRSRKASSRVGALERSGQDPRKTRTDKNPAAQETSTDGADPTTQNTTQQNPR